MDSWNTTLSSWPQQNGSIYFIIITITVSTISCKIAELSKNCRSNLCQRFMTNSRLKSRFYGLPSTSLATIKNTGRATKKLIFWRCHLYYIFFPLQHGHDDVEGLRPLLWLYFNNVNIRDVKMRVCTLNLRLRNYFSIRLASLVTLHMWPGCFQSLGYWKKALTK